MTYRKTLKFSLVAALAGLALAACDPAGQEPTTAGGPLLYAWMMDADSENPDFLAVIDADPASAGYGTIVGTVVTEGKVGYAHHTNHSLPSSGFLFGNDFGSGITHIFDTNSDPRNPAYKGHFTNQGEYTYPHSFAELPNGNILATFQTKGEGNEVTGGLVEVTTSGEMVRASDAEDPDAFDFIRPYSLEILPGLDRVVSTSSDMNGKDEGYHAQIWRLSDLALLNTIELPEPERAEAKTFPMEPRVLADGKTVLIDTYFCGFYKVSGIETDQPRAEFIYDFGGDGCAIVLVIGDYWIQATGAQNAVIVMDVSDPASPFEASRLTFDETYQPHWVAGMGDRIALSGYGTALEKRIVMLDFNPATGTLSVDENFGAGDQSGPGVMINIENWPHGDTGPALAHGMVFRKGEK